jgi:hypothetical protein
MTLESITHDMVGNLAAGTCDLGSIFISLLVVTHTSTRGCAGSRKSSPSLP